MGAAPANADHVQLEKNLGEFGGHQARGPKQLIACLGRQTENAAQPVHLVGVARRPPPPGFDLFVDGRPFTGPLRHIALAQAGPSGGGPAASS